MQRESNIKKTQSKENDIFQNICQFFSLLQNQENTLQAYREALTTRSDFHPLALFNYISRSQGFISRRSIVMFLEQNRFVKGEDQIKILFGLYGYKEKLDFYGFLNYIYPSSIQPLKYISTVGLKKYNGIPIEQGVNQQLVCLFLLLLVKELQFIQELQNFKQEYFPKLSKSQIKKIVKLIKKKCESKSYYEIQSENVVTFNEMRVCLRKMKNIQENKINSICRRLSMGKDNFINVEQMEFWLKSWNRPRNQDTVQKQTVPKTLMQDFQTSILR